MSADERTAWSKPVPLAAALSGEPPPEPRIGQWTDVVDGKASVRALFYPNEVHSVGGEPESMKSWLLLHAAEQEVQAGHHVLFVDMEANDRSIVDRLLRLGAKPAKIKRHFHYFRPEGHISEADQRRFRWWVKQKQPTLVVLDGVTEAYAMHGLSINAAEDAAHWFQNFGRQFQAKPGPGYDGPAIVELDHVVKDKDSRGGWTLGTQHKKAGIKGAMYLVEPVRPLGKGKHGMSRLFLSKDSPGGVKWEQFKGNRRHVADFHVDAEGEDHSVDAWIESAEARESATGEADLPLVETYDFRLLMQRVGSFIAENPGCSLRRLRGGIEKASNEHVALAVEQLIAEGYVSDEGAGNRRQYLSRKDFSALRVVPGGGDS